MMPKATLVRAAHLEEAEAHSTMQMMAFPWRWQRLSWPSRLREELKVVVEVSIVLAVPSLV
jgi:hypothetical protein